jgi:chromate reductase, NAD(P)H dehydrogenase (quinone)
MMTVRNVAVLVGSLRQQSFNRMIADEMIALAPDSLALEIVEIGDLIFFDQDLEESPPANWVAFRARIAKADAVLFVTPEYNRSVPAVLKNAIDVGSRPYGQSVWNGKPAAVASASLGAIGGFGATHHLRQSLTFVNMPTLQQPEVYLGNIAGQFDETGTLNAGTRDLLKGFMAAFAAWIEKIRQG